MVSALVFLPLLGALAILFVPREQEARIRYVALTTALLTFVISLGVLEWLMPTEVVHSPILTDGMTWSFDNSRHFMRVATGVNRDAIFRDLFQKLRLAHSSP